MQQGCQYEDPIRGTRCMAPIANFQTRLCLSHAKMAVDTHVNGGRRALGEQPKGGPFHHHHHGQAGGAAKVSAGGGGGVLELWLTPPVTWRSEYCQKAMKGQPCLYGHTCAFAHSQAQLRHVDDPLPKLMFHPKVGEPEVFDLKAYLAAHPVEAAKMERAGIIKPQTSGITSSGVSMAPTNPWGKPKPAEVKPLTALALKPATEVGLIECSVCADDVRKCDRRYMPCGHTICSVCVENIRKTTIQKRSQGTECPFCREVVAYTEDLPQGTEWNRAHGVEETKVASVWGNPEEKAVQKEQFASLGGADMVREAQEREARAREMLRRGVPLVRVVDGAASTAGGMPQPQAPSRTSASTAASVSSPSLASSPPPQPQVAMLSVSSPSTPPHASETSPDAALLEELAKEYFKNLGLAQTVSAPAVTAPVAGVKRSPPGLLPLQPPPPLQQQPSSTAPPEMPQAPAYAYPQPQPRHALAPLPHPIPTFPSMASSGPAVDGTGPMMMPHMQPAPTSMMPREYIPAAGGSLGGGYMPPGMMMPPVAAYGISPMAANGAGNSFVSLTPAFAVGPVPAPRPPAATPSALAPPAAPQAAPAPSQTESDEAARERRRLERVEQQRMKAEAQERARKREQDEALERAEQRERERQDEASSKATSAADSFVATLRAMGLTEEEIQEAQSLALRQDQLKDDELMAQALAANQPAAGTAPVEGSSLEHDIEVYQRMVQHAPPLPPGADPSSSYSSSLKSSRLESSPARTAAALNLLQGASSVWPCPLCTFDNDLSKSVCDMCMTARPSA